MKKTLIFASMAALALVSCNKMESPTLAFQDQNELSFIPMAGNNNIATRGYSQNSDFYYTPFMELHQGTPNEYSRDMHISAYQYPQNGNSANFFVDRVFKELGTGRNVWANFDVITDKHSPIYWPLGCTMDFLAYSIAEEEKESETTSVPMAGHDHIKVVWDANNAASQVVLDVPGESSQDDILFASSSNRLSEKGNQSVAMKFKHAQAWIQFQVYGAKIETAKDSGEGMDTSTSDYPLVTKIVLNDIYNAGKLTIDNNLGNAIANWNFSAETQKDIVMDDNWGCYKNSNKQKVDEDALDAAYFDMLIPEQRKTSFTIYYTIPGIADEQSYEFTTDQKTWLMGEKYIYKIKLSTSEITVEPSVQQWHDGGTSSETPEGGYNGNYPYGGSR